jgi:trigger factor
LPGASGSLPAYMKTTLEPLEGNKVKLSIEVDEAEFDKAIDAAFRKIARETRIPGFRPGKAPRRILEARFGSDVARDEALRDALPDYYEQALREQEVDPIAPPEIEITGGQESGPVQFEAVVEIRPQVSVAGYQGLRVTVANPAVTDEEIDSQIDRLRDQFAELQTVSRAAHDGDHVLIDLSGYRHSEQLEGLTADDFLYELGSGSVVPELDEQLRGAKAGDILKFTAAVPGQEEDVAFQVLVKEVKEKLLPDVTDEWASDASEFETVDALRDDIRTRLGAVKRVQAQLALREQAVDAVAELVSEEIPEPLVNEEMQRRAHDLEHRLAAQGADVQQYLEATGRSLDEFRNDLREAATRAVKADLALRGVADAEGLEATDEELDAEIERIAQAAGQKPAAVRKQLDRNDQLPAVRSDIRKGKALAWLTEHVEIADEEGHIIDRAELMNPTAENPAEETPAEETPSE